MEHVLIKEVIINKSACRAIGIIVFVIAMALGAYVRIPLPFTPVPLTLQTFFVLLSAAFLGAGASVTAQVIYIILGLSGLSIFSGFNTGSFYLFGPTAGYLLGFVFSAYFLGKIIRKIDRNFISVFTAFILADAVILLCGTLWLKLLFFKGTAIAFMLGFLPFVFGDIIKAFIAAVVYFKFKDRLREIY